MKTTVIGCGSLLLLAIIIVALTVVGKQFTCGARWPDHETKWGILSGCTVKTSGGKYIPEGRIRDVLP